MADVDISAAHNTARLGGTLAHLDEGTGRATIEIYAAPRPTAGSAPAAAPLVAIPLARPCGVLTDVLTLAPFTAEGPMILVTGEAAWARFMTGAGNWSMDAEVGLESSTAPVRLGTRTLLAGGRCPLLPSAIG